VKSQVESGGRAFDGIEKLLGKVGDSVDCWEVCWRLAVEALKVVNGRRKLVKSKEACQVSRLQDNKPPLYFHTPQGGQVTKGGRATKR
jgi:hypothetical protein